MNDTVTLDPRTDDDIRGYVAAYFNAQPHNWQTWYHLRLSGTLGERERSAANKTAPHANTPTTNWLDVLGRPFLITAHNGFMSNGSPVLYSTCIELDIEGNQLEISDAIVQNDDERGRIVIRYNYDMLSNIIHEISMVAGARWMLSDVSGKQIRVWDNRGHIIRTEYDLLRRPQRIFLTTADLVNPRQDILIERLVYGEQHPEDDLRNLRGKIYLHLDQAGILRNENYDFKDNLLRVSRRLSRQYKHAIDWRIADVDNFLPINHLTKVNPVALETALAPLLEAETFTSRTMFDALDRPIQVIAPCSDRPGAKRNVIQSVYDETTRLEQLHVWLDYPMDPTGLLNPINVPPSNVGIYNIDYDAKGRRKRIDYVNSVSTYYEYDPLTLRLVHLVTQRNAITFPNDCPKQPVPGWPGCQVQNLYYTYDPIGNITHIRDDAQQTVYFRNKRVEPSSEFDYDAIYRLTEARGREHLGQIEGAINPYSHNDTSRIRLHHPNDGNAMGTYIERYYYDAVGNILQLQHSGSNPANPGWTRRYNYSETSLIEDGTAGSPPKISNRLSSTKIGNDNPLTDQYMYDAHGNTTYMPHLGVGGHPDVNMHWNYRDQLYQTDHGGGGTCYYVYDAAGDRTHKVWEKSSNFIEERIYLGGFEIFRQKNGTGRIILEIETLHIMDDQQRVAVVETRTIGENGPPAQLIRYQLVNHIGSTSLELDHEAQIITYEEYYPYGSTSYQAVRNQIEIPLKRYRYIGKEKDNESGLYYHGARYYAPWLCRWISSDPIYTSLMNTKGRSSSMSSLGTFSETGNIDANKETETRERHSNTLSYERVNTYYYANDNPVILYDPNGESPISVIIKQAVKVGLKKALKEYIENTMKTKIRDYVGKKVPSKAFAKQFAKDADDVLSLLDSEWWEYAIEFIPVAGDIYGAASLGKKGKEAWEKITAIESKISNAIDKKRFEILTKWTSRWGEEGAKKIGDAVDSRKKLRAATPASDTLIQAHHVIPIELLEKNEVAQAALMAGFDFNSKTNVWLLKKSEHLKAHDVYNELLTERLETWAIQNPGFTPEQAKAFLERDVVPEWRKNFVDIATY